MADGSLKFVLRDVIKLWGYGPNVPQTLFTDLTSDMPNGDTIDLNSLASVTVNSSESAAVAATSLNTNEQLVKNITAFINQGMTVVQRTQLLNGSFPQELMALIVGAMKDDIDRTLLHYLIARAGSSTDYQGNIAADALTDDDVYDLIGYAGDQVGVSFSNWAWVMSPVFAAQVKKVDAFQPVVNQASNVVGLPQIGTLGGLPAFEHAAMPGRNTATRYAVTSSAVSISSNVATITVPSGHGILAGQQIWTSGLTANIAVTAPATVTSVTATTIVVPLTAGDGAMADGVGTIYSASSMAALVYKPWLYYAEDSVMQTPEMVKREANAGYAMQLSKIYGRYARLGGVFLLHAPD